MQEADWLCNPLESEDGLKNVCGGCPDHVFGTLFWRLSPHSSCFWCHVLSWLFHCIQTRQKYGNPAPWRVENKVDDEFISCCLGYVCVGSWVELAASHVWRRRPTVGCSSSEIYVNKYQHHNTTTTLNTRAHTHTHTGLFSELNSWTDPFPVVWISEIGPLRSRRQRFTFTWAAVASVRVFSRRSSSTSHVLKIISLQ